jgi:hypothetical protein
VVTQIYVANEKFCQLAQGVNDIVGLIKPHDPSNQPHMWFVDNGEREGFVPSQALTPYAQHGDNLNLIDLGEENKKEAEASKRESAVDLLTDIGVFSPPKVEEMVGLILDYTETWAEFEIDYNFLFQFCIALYPFKGQMANMIDLQYGEIYKVIEKFDKKNNPEWWLVEYNSKRGYVPSSYVKLLD